MKNIILAVCLVFGIYSISAKCANENIQYFPLQKEISLNSMFIIEGFARSQATILSFKTQKLYLESERGDLIELGLQDILVGQMFLTQAIFKPCQQLETNTKYYLKYQNQTENEISGFVKYNYKTNREEVIFWETKDQIISKEINSSLEVEFLETTVSPFGCGPATNATFAINNSAEDEIWFKTEMVELVSNTNTVFYLNAKSSTLDVGHGMCAGAFRYKETGSYKVRFTPINLDNKALATTDWIIFESPYLDPKSGY